MTKVWPMAREQQAHKISLSLRCLAGFREPRRFCTARNGKAQVLHRWGSTSAQPTAGNTHEKLALWCTLAIAALRELSWKETGSSRPELQSETHLNNKETREAELWLLPGP